MPRLLVLAAAWFVGLFLAATHPPAWPLPVLWTLIALLVAVALVSLGRRGGRPTVSLAALALLAATLGGLRVSLADWRPALAAWQPAFGREAVVVGMVDGDAETSGGRTTVRVAVDGLVVDSAPWLVDGAWLRRAGAPSPDDGRLVCSALPAVCAPAPALQARVRTNETLRYGDIVRLSGRLEAAPVLETFSYQETLARSGVYAVLQATEVTKLAEGQGPPLRQAAVAVRDQAETIIDELYPRRPVEAGLLKGALLGLNHRLPDDAVEALRRASLSHLIVVSGFNITIVVLGVVGLLALLRLGAAWLAALAARTGHWRLAALAQQPLRGLCVTSPLVPLLALLAVAGYVLLVGASPSASRAALMGAAVVLGLYLGRPSTAIVTLAAAAWLITLATPWAAFDVGFQLSFAGTLGLVVVAPLLLLPLGARLAARGWSRGLVEAVSVTLGATLMTAPLLAYYFGQFSLVGLAANMLALPAQPPLMYLGGAAVIAARVWPWLGQQLAALAWLPLAWTVETARRLGEAPWAATDAQLGVVPMALVYAGLAAVGYWASRRWRRPTVVPSGAIPLGPASASGALHPVAYTSRGWSMPAYWPAVAVALVSVGWLVALIAAARADGLLRVTLVGGGEAVVVRTPSGERLALGGGATATDFITTLDALAPPWDRSLAVVAATRADRATIAAFASVLQRYHVRYAASPPLPDGAGSVTWQREMREQRIAALGGGEPLALPDGVSVEAVAVGTAGGVTAYRLRYGEVEVVVADDGVRGRVLLSAGDDQNGGGQRTLAPDQLQRHSDLVTIVTDGRYLWLERGD